MNSHRESAAATLFLGDLSIFCTVPDLLEVLSPFGPVEYVDIKVDPKTGRCLNYGFVRYRYPASADAAMEGLQGVILHGREIKIGRPKGVDNYKPVKCSAGSHTHQVHCIFTTFQTQELITEGALRSAFSLLGNVVDVCVKKLTINEALNKQEGYAFVHFPDTAEGVEAAAKASQMQKVKIGKVMFDCKPSHDFKRFLQLRGEEHAAHHGSNSYPSVGVAAPHIGSSMSVFPNGFTDLPYPSAGAAGGAAGGAVSAALEREPPMMGYGGAPPSLLQSLGGAKVFSQQHYNYPQPAAHMLPTAASPSVARASAALNPNAAAFMDMHVDSYSSNVIEQQQRQQVSSHYNAPYAQQRYGRQEGEVYQQPSGYATNVALSSQNTYRMTPSHPTQHYHPQQRHPHHHHHQQAGYSPSLQQQQCEQLFQYSPSSIHSQNHSNFQQHSYF